MTGAYWALRRDNANKMAEIFGFNWQASPIEIAEKCSKALDLDVDGFGGEKPAESILWRGDCEPCRHQIGGETVSAHYIFDKNNQLDTVVFVPDTHGDKTRPRVVCFDPFLSIDWINWMASASW